MYQTLCDWKCLPRMLSNKLILLNLLSTAIISSAVSFFPLHLSFWTRCSSRLSWKKYFMLSKASFI